MLYALQLSGLARDLDSWRGIGSICSSRIFDNMSMEPFHLISIGSNLDLRFLDDT